MSPPTAPTPRAIVVVGLRVAVVVAVAAVLAGSGGRGVGSPAEMVLRIGADHDLDLEPNLTI